jgi:predicted dehydrogenase
MFKAAVAAGKHIFCEKPHALDIPGLKVTMAACEEARKKKLNVVSGLCWRYDTGVRETIKRVHEGAIGEILVIQEKYLTVPYIIRERRQGQSELEYQMWNWYHFNWLSGDQTAQQLIHSIDKASWALRDTPPVKAWGMGGRQTCRDPKYGDQFDHQAVVFEYAGGAHVFGFTRDQLECYNNTSDVIFGTKGRCNVMDCVIEGENKWKHSGPRPNMYDVEHKELFDAIRSGKRIDNGQYMCLSSALAIVAQMVCYSGEVIPWDEAMQSRRSYSLPRYGWDVEPPVKPDKSGMYPTAMHGKAEFEKWIG